jgi:AraC-like DNA-binding protein/mannose-6-phosphate isomerase-like protein (cupin superfamily)
MQLIVERHSTLAASEPVACQIVRGANFGCVWHHHPEFEITLVRLGGTERWVGDKLTRLKPGDMVLLGSGLPHDYRNDRPAGVRLGNVEAVVVQFMPNLLGDDWLRHASMRPVQQLFERASLGLEIKGATRARATARMNQLSKAKGLRRVTLLLELLDDLSRSRELVEIASPGFHSAISSVSSDRIGAVVSHIEAHMAAPLYVPELARMTGLSESAFSRLFKKCTCRTVPQYVNELRIARACRLLAETDQTVSQIADACGYSSPAHFQRQFQKQQKRSPLLYRSTVRKQG